MRQRRVRVDRGAQLPEGPAFADPDFLEDDVARHQSVEQPLEGGSLLDPVGARLDTGVVAAQAKRGAHHQGLDIDAALAQLPGHGERTGALCDGDGRGGACDRYRRMPILVPEPSCGRSDRSHDYEQCQQQSLHAVRGIGGLPIIPAMTDQTPTNALDSDLDRIVAGSTAVLPHWGCIDAQGPEAEAFLQSQLTNDVAAIAPDGVGIGGYCTPKGRLLATFLLARSPQGFRMLCSRDVLPPTAKRLSMFVLRAKLKIVDRAEHIAVLGAHGEAAPAALAELGFDP